MSSSARVPPTLDLYLQEENNFHYPLDEDEFPSTQVPNEAGVIIGWDFNLSQNQKSDGKFDRNLPVPRKRRQYKPKEAEPSCSTSPVQTRRKRLLRKENPEFISRFKALSEKVKKSKEIAKKKSAAAENVSSTVNSVSVSSTSNNPSVSSTSNNVNGSSSTVTVCEIDLTEDNEAKQAVSSVANKNIAVLQQENVSPVKVTTPSKNNSFSDFFEDLDDDSLIKCTQQAEQCIKQTFNKTNHELDCKESFVKLTSPGRSRLSVKLGSPRSPKISLGKVTTPAKVISSKYPAVVNSVLRRSPRLCGKPKELKVSESMSSRSNVLIKSSSSNIAQSTQKNNSVFDDILLSFLEEDNDLLSQVPDVSTSRSPRDARNAKSVRVGNGNESEVKRSQNRISLDNSFKKSEANGKVPLAVSKGNPASNAVIRHTNNNVSFSASKNSNVPPRTPLASNNLPSLDDSFISSDVLDVLDKTESKLRSGGALYTLPSEAKRKSLDKEERSNSPPLRCTPEEIEVKRKQALQRLQSRQDQSFSSFNAQFSHGSMSKSAPVPSNTKTKQTNIGGSQRYTAEEIERKRLEALQKRLQRQREKAMQSVNRTKYQPLSAKHTKWC